MIFSNEPGIYFSDHLLKTLVEDEICNPLINWEKLSEYKKEVRGVRIEDNFVVRKNGSLDGNYINLTTGLPRMVEDIEAAMQGDQFSVDTILKHL